MRRRNSNRWAAGITLLGIAVSACNELLDNDPRSWDPEAGEDAGAPASGGAGELGKGGTSGRGGRGGKGGASGKGGNGGRGGGTSGGGGTATSGRGGMATGEAGTTAGFGGDVESGGEGGGDSASGAGGGPVCECTPGDIATNVQACGDCLTGTQTQTKTCTEACTWGPFGAFGECTGVTAACSPGTPGSQSVACPCGGTKSQARTCTESCEWGPWADTSGCDLECCSEVVFCNTPDDIAPASRGTWCRETHSACSNEEVDADCYEDIPMVCDGLVPELYIEYR